MTMSLGEYLAACPVRIELGADTPAGKLYIREMTGAERDDFEAWIATRRTARGDLDTRGMRAELVSRCVCDAHGSPLCQSEDDRAALDRMPAGLLQRLFEAAQAVNGLGAEIEAVEGN